MSNRYFILIIIHHVKNEQEEIKMAKISMNSTATKYCNLVQEIKIAKELGFEGVEIVIEKIYSFLEAGYDEKELLSLLEGLQVVSIGAMQNIERQGADYDVFMKEMKRACELGEKIGTKMIQLCTGPGDVNTVRDFYGGKLTDSDPRYRGLLGASEDELIEKTAANVAAAADLAADHGIELFLEPLAWVPLKKISQAVSVIEAAGKNNVGVVIDLWHMWTCGETPEYVASLDKNMIKMVHICDGIRTDDPIPDQDVLRNVWTGEGDIPIKRYIDAVKSTGYDGWYSTEIFSKKIYERDPRQTAGLLKQNFEYMLGINM